MFDKSIIFADDVKTRVCLWYGPHGELAGFVSASLAIVEYGGKKHGVYRASVNTLRGYQGGGYHTTLFGIKEFLRIKARHPRMPVYYLSMTVSPVAYQVTARFGVRVYPNRHEPTPAAVEDFVRMLVQKRAYDVVDGKGPWVVKHPWLVSQPERLTRVIERKNDPDMLFFCQINPHYLDGHGLIMLVPLSLANMAAALRTMVLSALVPDTRQQQTAR